MDKCPIISEEYSAFGAACIFNAALFLTAIPGETVDPVSESNLLFFSTSNFICECHAISTESGAEGFPYTGWVMIDEDGGRECLGAAIEVLEATLSTFGRKTNSSA